MALLYNATFDKNTRKLAFEDRAGNEIYSFIVPEREKDDITKPLTFRATQDGSTVKLTQYGNIYSSFQTSRDGGKTWTNYTIDTAITLNTGDEVSFRVNTYSKPHSGGYYHFMMTGKIEAWHNVMSITKRGGSPMQEPIGEYEFKAMFSGCRSLTKAPILPETQLAGYCYERMFSGCTSLTKAPVLPATRLVRGCYYCMFRGCTSLTEAPELPATTLAENCYNSMFSGCQSLKEVRVSATTTATNALTDWLKGVSATGDFYCDPNATIFPTGTSGIPEGWRRLNINDYPATNK